jgi:hypothetical protein
LLDSSPVMGSVIGNLWSLPAARLITPLARDVRWEVANGEPLLDEDAEQPLVERHARFSSFLHHAEPSHALLIRKSAASQRREASLSARAPFGVKVQEQVIPALSNEPIAQRDGRAAQRAANHSIFVSYAVFEIREPFIRNS